MKKKIYVASSWRNKIQPEVVESLRKAGYEVYDFKNPEPGSYFKRSYKKAREYILFTLLV